MVWPLMSMFRLLICPALPCSALLCPALPCSALLCPAQTISLKGCILDRFRCGWEHISLQNCNINYDRKILMSLSRPGTCTIKLFTAVIVDVS
jgi:hypothetical protein